MRLTTTRDAMLKNEATIALPRHDRETPTNTCSPFILVLIILLHSISFGKLSLSKDLFILYHIKMFFFSLGTVIFPRLTAPQVERKR